MRRYFTIMTLVVMLTLLVSSNIPAFAEDFGYEITYIVDAKSGVNIRDKDKNITGVAKHGSAIQVVGQDKYWLKVKNKDGSIGYVYKQYAHVGHAEELEALEKASRKSVKIPVTNSLARFVAVAQTDIKVYKDDLKTKLGTISAGETVFIRQTGKYWYKVIWGGNQIAYIKAGSGFKITGPNVPSNLEGTPMILTVPQGEQAYLKTEPHGKTIAKYSSGGPIEGFLVLEIEGGWAKVVYDDQGNVGYIGKRFLKTSKMFE